MHHPESHVEKPFEIILTVLGFTTLFAAMTAFVKLATNTGVPVTEIMFWRFAFGLIPVLFWLGRKKAIKKEFLNREWQPLVYRAVMGMIAMWCTFKSFALLPIAEATTLHFTSVFILTILSIWVLGEKVGPYRWSAIVMGFIGVLLVLRPDGTGEHVGHFIALCAAVIMAMNMLLVRTLSSRVSAHGLTLYFHVIGTLGMFPFVVHDWQMPSPAAWFWLLGGGVSAGAAQILLNGAYLKAPAAFVSGFTYIQIVFVTLLGWLVFGDHPTPTFLAGASIIVAGGVVIAIRQALLHRKNRLEEAL